MSLVMDRIRRRESSDNKIMPSMLSYSSRRTYAPISAIDNTCKGNGDIGFKSMPSANSETAVTHLHHHHIIHFGILIFIETTILMLGCHCYQILEIGRNRCAQNCSRHTETRQQQPHTIRLELLASTDSAVPKRLCVLPAPA